MCIIVAKPAGQSVPDETIERCMNNNPDGAGFAILRDERVVISKGYFKSDDLLLSLSSLKWKDYPCIVHARIATSGTVSMENCHPFPITRDVAMLSAHYLRTDCAIAHNGTVKWGSEEELKGESDTFLFVRDVAGAVWEAKNEELWYNILTHVAGANDCRFATLDDRGIRLYGKGWHEEAGVYYSNKTYKYRSVIKYYGTSALVECENCGHYCIPRNGEELCYFCRKGGYND